MFQSLGFPVGLQDKARFKDQIVGKVSLPNITAEGLGTQKIIFATNEQQQKQKQTQKQNPDPVVLKSRRAQARVETAFWSTS